MILETDNMSKKNTLIRCSLTKHELEQAVLFWLREQEQPVRKARLSSVDYITTESNTCIELPSKQIMQIDFTLELENFNG